MKSPRQKADSPHWDLLQDAGQLAARNEALLKQTTELSEKARRDNPGGQNHTALINVRYYLIMAAEALKRAEGYAGHLTPDRQPE